MLDSIISSLKDQLIDKIDDFGLTEDKAEKAVSIAQESVIGSVVSESASGGIGSILNLFNGNQTIEDSSFVHNLVSTYASDLIEKVGISPEQADLIAKFAVPFIMSKINDNTPESGVEEGGLMDIIKQGATDSATNMITVKLKDGIGNLFKF